MCEGLETLTERSEKVVEQIRKRLAGEPTTNRLVSGGCAFFCVSVGG